MGPGRRDLTGGQHPAGAVPVAPPGPVRTCVGCRRRASVDELVRVAVAADGQLVVGRGLPGRGAWLCRGRARCFELAAGRRAFGRALRRPVPEAEVEALRHQLALDEAAAGESARSSELEWPGARG